MRPFIYYSFVAFLLGSLGMVLHAADASSEVKITKNFETLFASCESFKAQLKLIEQFADPSDRPDRINRARGLVMTINKSINGLEEEKEQIQGSLPKPAAEVVEKVVAALSEREWDFSTVSDMNVKDEDMLIYFHRLAEMLSKAAPTEKDWWTYRKALSPSLKEGGTIW